MVLEEETTSANESDIRHLEPPLKKARLPERTPVCADRGYNSAEKQGSPGAHETESAHHMQHIMEAIACNLYQAPGIVSHSFNKRRDGIFRRLIIGLVKPIRYDFIDKIINCYPKMGWCLAFAEISFLLKSNSGIDLTVFLSKEKECFV